jgi:hypothetical protein
MRGESYNPIIGYLLIDANYHVISPPGEKRDVAFQSEERAWQAAEEYGVREQVAQVTALHLGGILSVVWDDVGDIYLDGVGAKRLVTACQRRGITVKGKARRGIKGQVVAPIYSSRKIVGDGPEYMF